ncbi:MAG: DUF3017 domain-containing protein [Flaviflexus sp.]|nr:DUF3017 domain-containing protein [Flaviflexus sp.]
MGETRVPSPVLFVVMTLWICAVTVIAVLADARWAATALGGSMICLAVARLVLPAGVVPQIRRRFWDAATLAALGIALLALASWGNATLVS